MDSETKPPSKRAEYEQPELDIACVSPRVRRALVSDSGNHCQVWRGGRRSDEQTDGQNNFVEFVLKYPRDSYTDADIRILRRQYEMLRESLGDMVPEALFAITCINGKRNVFVLARAVNIWFNIANPTNREEAVGLLQKYPMARDQLQQFVDVARGWREGPNPRVIDLYGMDNLVMDNQRQIRYIDSFYVFFFEDLLHILGGERDLDLEDKINVSLRRLAYLEEILALSADKQ